MCDKVCHWLVTGRWFSPGTRVSSTNKTDCHYIIEILLKVVLNLIILKCMTCAFVFLGVFWVNKWSTAIFIGQRFWLWQCYFDTKIYDTRSGTYEIIFTQIWCEDLNNFVHCEHNIPSILNTINPNPSILIKEIPKEHFIYWC